MEKLWVKFETRHGTLYIEPLVTMVRERKLRNVTDVDYEYSINGKHVVKEVWEKVNAMAEEALQSHGILIDAS